MLFITFDDSRDNFATPNEVISLLTATLIFLFIKSAKNCEKKLLLDIPPSIFISFISISTVLSIISIIAFVENFDDIEKAIEFSNLNQVMVIPAINGLGAPFWNGNVRASLENLSSNTTREDIIRATFESIAFSTKAIIEIIERTVDIDINEMKIDGGISRSKFFSQFLADLINKKIKVAANTEITSLGVAKLSLESSQVIKSNSNSYIDFNPNKNNLEIYNNKYEKWKKIILEKTKES